MGADEKVTVLPPASPGGLPREGGGLTRGRIAARIWAVLADGGASIRPRLTALYRDLPPRGRQLFAECLCRSVAFYPEHRDPIRLFLEETGWIDWVLRQTGSRSWWKRAAGARAIGNLGVADAAGILARLLEDPREAVRAAAGYSLVQIGGPSSLRMLVGAADVGKLGGSPELSFLLYYVASHEPELVLPLLGNARRTVRLAALSALINTGCRQAAPRIIALLQSGDPETRALAAKGVGRLRLGEARPLLAVLLEDEAWRVRASAARALRELRTFRPHGRDRRSGSARRPYRLA